MKFRVTAAAVVIALAVLASGAFGAATFERQIAPGVQLIQRIDPASPTAVMGVKLDPRQQGLRIGAFVGNDRIQSVGGGGDREIVSSAMKRKGAVAGINGDFFPWTGDPLGLTIVDGRLVSEPDPKRPAVGVTEDGGARMGVVRMSLTFFFDNGRFVRAEGVDRPATAGDLVVYEQEWGATTGAGSDCAELILKLDWKGLLQKGEADATISRLVAEGQNSPVPSDGVVLVAKGVRVRELVDAATGQSTVRVKLMLQEDNGRSWLGVVSAVGGGSWLVKDAASHERGEDAGFGSSFVRSRHPRTAVGITKNGYILFLVVDGRQITSRGATLPELVNIMLDQGCVEAINLDGGGSSTLNVRDMVINSPSDGRQRAVASGLLVFAPEFSGLSSRPLLIRPGSHRAMVGTKQQFEAQASDGTDLSADQKSKVVWGTANGGGFISQDGLFTALREGTPSVKAWLAGSSGQASVTVVASGPPVISLSWGMPSTAGTVLHVRVTDAAGNVIAFPKVQVAVAGGRTDTPVIECGPDGVGRAVVAWQDVGAAGQRRVTATYEKAEASLDAQ